MVKVLQNVPVLGEIPTALPDVIWWRPARQTGIVEWTKATVVGSPARGLVTLRVEHQFFDPGDRTFHIDDITWLPETHNS